MGTTLCECGCGNDVTARFRRGHNRRGVIGCTVDGCDRPHLARGLCKLHYDRKRTTGEPGPATPMADRTPPEHCIVAGCARSCKAKGYCAMHYGRLLVHGEVGGPERLLAHKGGGYVNKHGYRRIYLPAHPLGAARHDGQVEEHRVVLYDSIGPGPHACYWCGTEVDWFAEEHRKLQTDHVNADKLDNRAENLVPSCRPCNTTRVAA